MAEVFDPNDFAKRQNQEKPDRLLPKNRAGLFKKLDELIEIIEGEDLKKTGSNDPLVLHVRKGFVGLNADKNSRPILQKAFLGRDTLTEAEVTSLIAALEYYELWL